jgi:hypothetical protein
MAAKDQLRIFKGGSNLPPSSDIPGTPAAKSKAGKKKDGGEDGDDAVPSVTMDDFGGPLGEDDDDGDDGGDEGGDDGGDDWDEDGHEDQTILCDTNNVCGTKVLCATFVSQHNANQCEMSQTLSQVGVCIPSQKFWCEPIRSNHPLAPRRKPPTSGLQRLLPNRPLACQSLPPWHLP